MLQFAACLTIIITKAARGFYITSHCHYDRKTFIVLATGPLKASSLHSVKITGLVFSELLTTVPRYLMSKPTLGKGVVTTKR
jgi:hypothetical protein